MTALLRHLLLTCCCLVTTPTVADAQSTHWVGPGTPHPDVSSALAAASAGDLIRVLSGVYPGFTLSFPATVAADDGAVVRFDSPVQVSVPDATGYTTLRGLHFAPDALTTGPFIAGPALTVTGCNGTVWIDRCSLAGAARAHEPLEIEGLRVRDSHATVVVESTISGGHSASPDQPGGAAITTSNARIHLWDSQVLGGGGASNILLQPAPGGPGLRATDSAVFVHDSDITGGAGGNYLVQFACHEGAAGGAGVILEGTARLEERASRIVGGAGGTSYAPCGTGPNGLDRDLLNPNALATNWAGPPLAVDAPATLFDPDYANLQLEIVGAPGTIVALAAAFEASSLPALAFLQGPYELDLSGTATPLGTIPASGRMVLPIDQPRIPVHADVLTIFLQPLGLAPGLGAFVGRPAALIRAQPR